MCGPPTCAELPNVVGLVFFFFFFLFFFFCSPDINGVAQESTIRDERLRITNLPISLRVPVTLTSV